MFVLNRTKIEFCNNRLKTPLRVVQSETHLITYMKEGSICNIIVKVVRLRPMGIEKDYWLYLTTNYLQLSYE